MRIYIVDDDKGVCAVLKMIINDRRLGEICGISYSGQDALEDVAALKPDIILADLLMPELDGITFAEKTKKLLPDTSVIMLSQVESKEMVSKAYESGIEFYIHKPVNAIEIENVLRNIEASRAMKRIIEKAQDLFTETTVLQRKLSAQEAGAENAAPARKVPSVYNKAYMQRLRGILQGIGISSESGSKDIISIVEYLMENEMDITETTLNELCGRLGQNPKSVEQRIRRAAFAGMVNLANKGLEDYADPAFNEYAGRLYNFEQIRREMNYIRGKSDKHGNVRIRNFVNGLLSYCKEM